ncbi:MAG TPA: hypothetical protein VEZ11_01770 [Thermoanaerobaculia bacterium]|nr:hypothetical protein [Thermoanaerobaculia bacterium]
MSVTEISQLHARYVRLTDRFKAIWTYHQFASGVFKNVLNEPLPYVVDFQKTYARIKGTSRSLNSAELAAAATAIDSGERLLDRITADLLKADDRIGPSLLRRFFEKLKKQDENIILYLIKFYFYTDAVEGDRRDKLDFFFTRIGEDFLAERGEYWSRDSLEFREKIIALVSILQIGVPPQEEIVRLIRAIRSMRDEIQDTDAFEQLTDRNLLRNARLFKHRLGDYYFHPDVLLSIVELNVSTKNKFLKLYHQEEQRIIEDSQKLMDHGQAIARNFGETNPELVEEIARFRQFKEQFDESRALSNVKHDVMTQLKASMNNILAQLDKGLESQEEEAPQELTQALFIQVQQVDNIAARFGETPLQPFLLRIATVLDSLPETMSVDAMVVAPEADSLRVEPWEAAAYLKLFGRLVAEGEEDTEELWMLYFRGAALRMKIDEEATILATASTTGVRPESTLINRAKVSLDQAKELDEQFGDFIHEAVCYANQRVLRQLYRSRFRLLRGFSGLWLIFDHETAVAPPAEE